jgi:hypothetical protein
MDQFYRVPLTSGEIRALLALLQSVESILIERDRDLPGAFDPALLRSARERIEGEVPEFIIGQTRQIAREFATVFTPPPAPVSVDTFVSPLVTVRQMLETACEQQTPVEIEYYVPSRDEWTQRKVDVEEVYEDEGTWYLSAYCHLRKDNRQFRLDRIRTVKMQQKAVQHRSKEM